MGVTVAWRAAARMARSDCTVSRERRWRKGAHPHNEKRRDKSWNGVFGFSYWLHCLPGVFSFSPFGKIPWCSDFLAWSFYGGVDFIDIGQSVRLQELGSLYSTEYSDTSDT